MRYFQINMVSVISESVNSLVLFISFGINEITKTRIILLHTMHCGFKDSGQKKTGEM